MARSADPSTYYDTYPMLYMYSTNIVAAVEATIDGTTVVVPVMNFGLSIIKDSGYNEIDECYLNGVFENGQLYGFKVD